MNAIVDPDNTIFWQDGNFFCSFFDGTINLPCWLLVVLCCSRHLHIIIKVKLWQHCFAIISQLTKAKDHWDWVFFYIRPSSVSHLEAKNNYLTFSVKFSTAVWFKMDDSDSGGLISPEEDLSGVESSGSSGHGRMEKTISRLKLKLRGFQEV